MASRSATSASPRRAATSSRPSPTTSWRGSASCTGVSRPRGARRRWRAGGPSGARSGRCPRPDAPESPERAGAGATLPGCRTGGRRTRRRGPAAFRASARPHIHERIRKGTARMRSRFPMQFRPATVIVAVAVLVLALGGTATAAKLITSRDVADNSLTGADIKAGSLDRSDLSASARRALQGAAGPRGAAGATRATGRPAARGASGTAGATGPAGPAGATGATGATGPAGKDAVVIFARVGATGAVVAGRNVGQTVDPPSAGEYTLHVAGAPDLSGCVAIAQPQSAAHLGASQAMALANADGTVHVSIVGPNGGNVGGGTSPTDDPFAVTVAC